jgi:hypothetical protein
MRRARGLTLGEQEALSTQLLHDPGNPGPAYSLPAGNLGSGADCLSSEEGPPDEGLPNVVRESMHAAPARSGW